MAEIAACGLPPHPERTKNWDLLIALGLILERTTTRGAVLEMGSTQYSKLLPWLYLYGYRSLVGIDLVYDAPIVADPIVYRPMDLTRTTFADASFDAIACLSVIEHGVDLATFARESARLLRPGGILVASTDYWHEPVETGGQEAYGVPIRILTPADIDRPGRGRTHRRSAGAPPVRPRVRRTGRPLGALRARLHLRRGRVRAAPLATLSIHARVEGSGAGDEVRTRDMQLGRLPLCQLSYSRVPVIVPPRGAGRYTSLPPAWRSRRC